VRRLPSILLTIPVSCRSAHYAPKRVIGIGSKSQCRDIRYYGFALGKRGSVAEGFICGYERPSQSALRIVTREPRPQIDEPGNIRKTATFRSHRRIVLVLLTPDAWRSTSSLGRVQSACIRKTCTSGPSQSLRATANISSMCGFI
jgi:hypothetical protein